MKAYFDTSVLTGVYCLESNSKKLQKILQSYTPVISSLTRIEFSSSVAKKYRMKTFTDSEASIIISTFHKHIRQEYFELISVKEIHLLQANEWIDSFLTGLRTLDAIQLAIAFTSNLTLITADKTLAASAKKLGVKVKFM